MHKIFYVGLFYFSLLFSVSTLASEMYFEEEIRTIINSVKASEKKEEELLKYKEKISDASLDMQEKYYAFLHKYYYEEYKIEKALLSADKLIEIYKIKDDKENLALIYIKKAEDLMDKNTGKANFYLEEALKIIEIIDNKNLLIFAKSNLAAVKSMQGFYFESLEILTETELYVDNSIEKKYIIELYTEMSYVYFEMKNNQKAQIYNKKILDIYSENNKKRDWSYIYILEAFLKNSRQEDKKFIEKELKNILNDNYEKSLQMHANKLLMMLDNNNIKNLNKINTLQNYFEKENYIEDYLDLFVLKVETLIYNKLYNEALNEIKKLESKEISKKRVHLKLLKFKSIVYENIGDNQNALKYAIEYQKSYEKGFNETFVKTIRDLKKMFNTTETEKENANLLKETKLKEERLVQEKENIKIKEKIMFGMNLILSITIIITIVTVIGYRRIKTVATIDDLTKIYNRKSITNMGEKIFKKNNCSVIIFDIDYFKKINDNFGHAVGDEVLKEVSKTVKNSLRKEDYFGRYGGEEFLVVLQKDINIATELADRLRKDIESIDFSEHGDLRVTASFGVSEKIEENNFEELVRSADEKLYESKENGRNKVTV